MKQHMLKFYCSSIPFLLIFFLNLNYLIIYLFFHIFCSFDKTKNKNYIFLEFYCGLFELNISVKYTCYICTVNLQKQIISNSIAEHLRNKRKNREFCNIEKKWGTKCQKTKKYAWKTDENQTIFIITIFES